MRLSLPAVLLAASCAAPKVTAPPAAQPAASGTQPAASGAPAAAESAGKSPAEAFHAFSARFLAEYLRRSPTVATVTGEHAYDGQWPDPSAEGEAELRAFLTGEQAALAAIPAAGLGAQDRIDAQILETRLASWLFSIDELREAGNNPLLYTGLVGSGIDPLVTRTFAPHGERMQSLLLRLRGIAKLVSVAKARLQHPPRVYTETALEQNRGLIHLVDGGLRGDFAQEPPAQQKALTEAAAQASAALSDFQIFLEKDLLPRSTGDFRIGADKFRRKLRFTLEDDLDPATLVRLARETIARTHEEMLATARELWPEVLPGERLPAAETKAARKALIKKVLDALAKDRPGNDTIVQESSRLLEDATAFVRAHDLVTLPKEPCKVIEMPEYRRGVAVAYCDSSGALEKNKETFVAISPTPADWKPERVESFFREYNRSMLGDLIVHEGMPGHYLQIMHSNQFNSPVRSIFRSGPFAEGWAVYAEWLMAKNGFGGARVRLERQKMILRTAANAILDSEIHTRGMTEAQALALMEDEAFQEEGEAVGKWRRAQLSSAQLSTYYYGFSELMKLREQLAAAPGFNERAYHDRLLGYGSPALRYVRELMLAP